MFVRDSEEERGRRIRYGEELTFERDGGPITARRVENFKKNNIFIQNGVSISKAELHRLNRQISDAKKLMGITNTCKIPIVIASKQGNVASYNPRTDVLFINPDFGGRNVPQEIQEMFVCPDNPLSTLVHEMFHWQDAHEYRKSGGIINDAMSLKVYTDHQRDTAWNYLSSNGFDLDHMYQTKVNLSEYAYEMHKDSNYEEVWTEFRTKQLLGGK